MAAMLGEEWRPRTARGRESVTGDLKTENEESMKVTHMDVRCDRSQELHTEIWCECRSIEDVDDLMAWLSLAKDMMKKWDKIRSRRAEASRTPKAAASQDEDSEQGQVQSGPRLAVGSNR